MSPVILLLFLDAPSTPPKKIKKNQIADSSIKFSRDIRPILSNHCFTCHGPDKQKGDMRLDTQKDLENITKSINGNAPLLLQHINSTDPDEVMPPLKSNNPLKQQQKDTLKKWIEKGAKYEQHWSYLQPIKTATPTLKDMSKALNVIDYFVQNKLEKHSLTPSNQADPATLMRRLYFDLIGLPPSSDQIKTFTTNFSNQSYEQLVNQLLSSKHFGERLAVKWLDLVRYADSIGYHGDPQISHSPYRDYVINSFNTNKPYDQFTIEQIAGDLLEKPTEEQLIATGYNHMLMTSEETGAVESQYLRMYGNDRVQNLGSVWLGTTLHCAKCHDHKYDPFTQDDYYSLTAFFADIEEKGIYDNYDEREHLKYFYRNIDEVKNLKQQQEHVAELKKKMDSSSEANSAEASHDAKMHLRYSNKLNYFQRSLIASPITIHTTPRETRILRRGNLDDTGGTVVLPKLPDIFAYENKTHKKLNRLDLATWLVSKNNPLASRVFVNVLWGMYFGKGFSETYQDLGAIGQWPSHPELFDWLSADFIENNWDIKRLIKTIVMSHTYKQSSMTREDLDKVDGLNVLLGRQNPTTIAAEFVRDNALAISGLLQLKQTGGPSIRPYQPEQYLKSLIPPASFYFVDNNINQFKRGLYVHRQRSAPHPSLLAFDAPSRRHCVAKRNYSNTPLQSLALLNDPTYVEASRKFAERIINNKANSIEDKIKWAYFETTSRVASETIINTLKNLYEINHLHYANNKQDARLIMTQGIMKPDPKLQIIDIATWSAIARCLMSLQETITRY